MFDSRKPLGAFAALALTAALIPAPSAAADKALSYVAPIMSAAGAKVGMARFIPVPGGGTQITLSVTGLPPGVHGVHIHEIGSCNGIRDTQGVKTDFGAAGGHFDPMGTKMHKGPDGGGHAGDLPALTVDELGNGGMAYFAKGLTTSGSDSIVGRAIVIHQNPDNYTDTPPNGGSGPRIACGEIGAAM